MSVAGLSFLLLCNFYAVSAYAQIKSPRAEVKFSFGIYGYDEDAVNAIGGAFAYYPNTRSSGEMEFLHLFDHNLKKINYRGFVLTPSFGADFRHSGAAFQPYGRLAETVDWVRGVGTHANFTVRFGFRFYVSDRFFVSPEMGLGERLNLKFTVSAGYVTAFQDALK
jgi:hypothetical protein